MAALADVLRGLQTTTQWQENLYKDIHAHPELSFHETRTAGLIASKLKELGYEVIEGIGRTGVVGILRSREGRTVLARADMDALPVKEATGLPYASTATAAEGYGTVNVSHACGHDAHVTCLLGAAELLAQARDAWRGTLVALFQPAEEVAGGARAMVDDGLRQRIPKPDVAFAQHVLAFPAGTVGTQTGPVLSAGDSIRITLHGKGAHGSMPHNSVDTVVLASQVVLRLQTIVSRETKPGDFVVLTVGSVAAGSKSNIIPDRAILLANLRTYDMDVRKRVISSVERTRSPTTTRVSPRASHRHFRNTSAQTGSSNLVASRRARISATFRMHWERRIRTGASVVRIETSTRGHSRRAASSRTFP
jgi:amidohydrolase